MITVFTPTYNRAYKLGTLYQSLIRQSCKDFEWVIVDDGSTDGTEALLGSFANDNNIRIKYLRQENQGKHAAINKGVQEAQGDMFFIVDSDDVLTPDAIEWVKETSSLIMDDPTFGGISGVLFYPDGKIIGGGIKEGEYIDSNAIDIRLRHGVAGDLAEVFKTSVLQEFPFPIFEDERFVPEALVWNRIAQKYKIRYTSRAIYCADYLPDGLTHRIVRLRRNAPMAAMTYYSELYHYDIPVGQRIKAAINFWRFAPAKYYSKVKEFGMLNWVSFAAWLPGVLMRLNDSRK